MADLTGKVVIVTGAGSGIGRTTAVAFAREGAKVVVANRRDAEGQETVRLVKEVGGDGLFVKTDVTQEPDVKALVNATVEAYGRLDYAFNNAGTEQEPAALVEQTNEAFDKIMSINVKGVWLCMKYQIPQMLKQGSGAIVNNASLYGLIGLANFGIYVASKHAVVGLTKSTALDYAKSGIRINAVNPGAIETEMYDRAFAGNEELKAEIAAKYPLGRVGQPGEIASAVLWLCSDGASFVTGQSLTIDGGLSA